jgi:hypothetical protein
VFSLEELFHWFFTLSPNSCFFTSLGLGLVFIYVVIDINIVDHIVNIIL